ncbi:IclR family transcriptional regulator [Rhodococcus sp. OK611]|uniref:IclR family transcriptional regulator n=1 Tax=unclassified Rhodococcus (in: high G+C Gram-positive bacteria) TaxID=192944 RepID=UPI000BD5A2F3|nr:MULTISPECIES: IclR family transcriptional regulator [unclassified Rhodococcus (in: high G+C Gram-positive bacteria)]PTR45004.1 IclR family transcriptional regulator [Rhodococcus sp. OK611]SNX89339.1 transcriptional regulator, IclR family [Rhodococcus sp. OK270]
MKATVNDAGRPQYPIESVDNALRILLLLGERRTLRLTEVSEYLSVASSTAHRLLAMLQYRGFVRQSDGAKTYEPGPALTTIAFAVLRQSDVRARLHPLLERLSAEVGETVHLSRLDGTAVTFIDAVESRQAVRVGARMGITMRASCTSSGKALLSLLDDQALREMYPSPRLEGLTGNSVTKRSVLLRQVAEVRENGYATSMEESEAGVASVAVPLGEYAAARYALNVSTPKDRMLDANRAEIVAALRKTADEAAEYFL